MRARGRPLTEQHLSAPLATLAHLDRQVGVLRWTKKWTVVLFLKLRLKKRNDFLNAIQTMICHYQQLRRIRNPLFRRGNDPTSALGALLSRNRNMALREMAMLQATSLRNKQESVLNHAARSAAICKDGVTRRVIYVA